VKLIEAICPACSANVEVPHTDRPLKCIYCGATLLIEHEHPPEDGRPSFGPASSCQTGHSLLLANNAVAAGNYSEAYYYFTKTLENEPTNCDAWLGKGLSAGACSPQSELRTSEIVHGIRTALQFAPNEQKATEIRTTSATEISAIAERFYEESESELVTVSARQYSIGQYLNSVGQVLDALYYAHELDPQNVNVLRAGIQVATRILDVSIRANGAEIVTYWSTWRPRVDQFLEVFRQRLAAFVVPT
jgi:hypothetical protein